MIPFSFSRQTNDELYTLARRVDEVLNPKPIDALGLTLYYNNFKEAFDKFVKGMKHIGINAKVVQLKDGVRDDYSLSLFHHIENYLCYPDEEIKKKVKALLDEIAKHGPNIQRRSYKKETAILETIIAKIEAEYMELMTQIGAMVWFSLLKEAQVDFEKTLRKYSDSKVEDDKVEAPSTVRPELVSALRKLFTFLPMQYELANNEELGKIIELIKVELNRF